MMAAHGFGIFLGVVAILGTLVVQGKWRSGKLLAHPHRLAERLLVCQNDLMHVLCKGSLKKHNSKLPCQIKLTIL